MLVMLLVASIDWYVALSVRDQEFETKVLVGCWNRMSCMSIDQMIKADQWPFPPWDVATHQSHWEFRRRRKRDLYALIHFCRDETDETVSIMQQDPTRCKSTISAAEEKASARTSTQQFPSEDTEVGGCGSGGRIAKSVRSLTKRWRVYLFVHLHLILFLKRHFVVPPEVCLHTKRPSKPEKCCPGRATELLQQQTMQVRVG